MTKDKGSEQEDDTSNRMTNARIINDEANRWTTG
jgi:hypothetical protein